MENTRHGEPVISELLERIEKTSYLRRMEEAGSVFKEVYDLATKRGEAEIALHARFEIEITHLATVDSFVKNDCSPRFVARLGYSDGGEWPSLCNFSKEQYSYYEHRLNETSNPFLKCRYAGVLFECYPRGLKLNKFELGRMLVDLLIETALAHLGQTKPNSLAFIWDIARAADVAIKLNNVKMLSCVVATLTTVIKNWANEDLKHLRDTSLIMRGIYSSPLGSQVPPDTYTIVTRRVEEARAFFLESEDLLHWHRSFCEELVAWGGLLGWPDDTLDAYRREIGESYEREAEAHATRYGSSKLAASFLEDALKHYRDIGATDKMDELKVRIREAHRASLKEYYPVSWTVEVPSEEIEKRLSPYRNLSVSDGLLHMASDDSLIVDVTSVEKRTYENTESSPLMSRIPRFIIDDDRKVFQSDSPETTFKWHFDSEYKKDLLVTAEALLTEVFRLLKETRGMTKEDVIDFLRNWPLEDERNITIVSVGIERFFAGDYVSALHILVPQFESCLRRMFAQARYPTTSIRESDTQHEQSLTTFLEREDVKAALEPNFHKYIQFVMVDQTGFNLRNDVAHGLIKPGDCNESNALMVIHLFLILTRFRIAPATGDQ